MPFAEAVLTAALIRANPALTPAEIAGFIEAHKTLLAATDIPTREEATALGVRKLAETTATNPHKVRIYWRRPRPAVCKKPPAPSVTQARRPRTARAPRRRRTAARERQRVVTARTATPRR